LKGIHDKITEDEVIRTYKFTNVYRCCDRVSQYLIRKVIYAEKFNTKDSFLRIIFFKLFNKIETWELLEQKFGVISEENFCLKKYKQFLDVEMNNGRVLYSNAYMMASALGVKSLECQENIMLICY
jgi:hypothetical protein